MKTTLLIMAAGIGSRFGTGIKQLEPVEQFKKMEEKKIPENINYDEIQSLRIEAKQKLNLYRPINIGQASRISGVSPADISVLLVYLGHK